MNYHTQICNDTRFCILVNFPDIKLIMFSAQEGVIIWGRETKIVAMEEGNRGASEPVKSAPAFDKYILFINYYIVEEHGEFFWKQLMPPDHSLFNERYLKLQEKALFFFLAVQRCKSI